MSQKFDYEKIMSDRKLFNETVYTPLSEAVKILEERQKDKDLIKKIENLLDGDVLEPLKKLGKNSVQFRQIPTPNHDTHWFIELSNDHKLKPIFVGYSEDKFIHVNSFKHSLAQLTIHKDKNDKKGNLQEEKITIIDFNKYNGKELKDIMTLWGEPLVDFHKNLFDVCGYLKNNLTFYDASSWYKRNGPKAVDYYTKALLLFICHSVFFENFLLIGRDGDFTKNVFLPALEKVIALTGLKPLIVPIPPMELEEDSHWTSYTTKVKDFIKVNKFLSK